MLHVQPAWPHFQGLPQPGLNTERRPPFCWRRVREEGGGAAGLHLQQEHGGHGTLLHDCWESGGWQERRVRSTEAGVGGGESVCVGEYERRVNRVGG